MEKPKEDEKMYNLYLKGLSTDDQELQQIRNLFKKNNLEFTDVFDSYENLSVLHKNKLIAEVNEQIRKKNPTMQNINLICHSMGCNLGVLAAEKSSTIKKMVLISPEFGEYSKKEKNQIQEARIIPSIHRPFGEQRKKVNKETFKSLIIFNQTKPWTTLAIERINIPVLIIYAKDDNVIPKEYLNHLSKRKDNIKVEAIDSKLHNPLTSRDHGQKTLNLIKKYLN